MASASKSSFSDSALPTSGKAVTLQVDDLLRTREQLVSGLSNISNAINEFVRSYVQHTNKWVGAENNLPSGVELASMANIFSAAGSSTTAQAGGVTASGEPALDKKGKRFKKVRKQKDPNAPKRPLTAFFLYGQSARPVVKQDFVDNGLNPSAQEISNEILKRWKEMTEAERQGWKDIYEQNAEKYREEAKVYKETTGLITGEDNEALADDAVVGARFTDDDGEAAPPAPKTKTTKAASKSKKKDAAPATDAASPSAQLTSRSTVPLPAGGKSAEPTPAPKTSKRKSSAAEDKTNEAPKKRQRKSKAEKDAEAAAKEASNETPKPKKGGRKSKSTKAVEA